jgi:hypothetical protein
MPEADGLRLHKSSTTGIGRFDECLKHSANPKKYSAKPLGKEGSANST